MKADVVSKDFMQDPASERGPKLTKHVKLFMRRSDNNNNNNNNNNIHNNNNEKKSSVKVTRSFVDTKKAKAKYQILFFTPKNL